MVACPSPHNLHALHPDMTAVSNDPIWWPIVGNTSLSSYVAVVSSVVVVYDWALTFGQELELVWMQHWSFVTILYICVRYTGLLNSVIVILVNLPVSITDVVGLISYFIWTCIPIVANAMLGVIVMIRIHAMYGRSKKMLIFLIVLFLVSTVASVITTAMVMIGVSAEEFVLLGYRMCLFEIDRDRVELAYERLIFTTIWEIPAFVLAVWICIKRFRELRRSPTGSIIGDSLTVLTKSHAFYFGAFATVACLSLGSVSTYIIYTSSVGSALYSAVLQVAQVLQMFVLGPWLILSIREYHAKLMDRSDERTATSSIHFQTVGDALTSGDV